MKIAIFVLCSAVAVFAQDTYDNSHDNFDISQVLENERLLTAYSKCLLDQGPCTPEVKDVRDKLPEALETHCAKCTERQKELGKKLAQELKKTHPKVWDDLVAHYDPQGKYQASFKEFLQN